MTAVRRPAPAARQAVMATPPIRVMIVEDNPGDVHLIREILRGSSTTRFEVAAADRLADGVARLGGGAIDVVLLDLGLPDSRGYETFARVHALAPRLPIIVLTGLGDEAVARKTMQAGAQDYLVKGEVDGNVLARAIRYAIERKQAEAEIRSLNETMEQALVAARTHLERVVNLSPAVIYAIKVNGDGFAPSWISENIRRLTGYDVEEALLPTWWVDHLHPDDRARVMDGIRALLTGGALTTEYRFRYSDGSYRWVHDESRLVRDDLGRPLEVFGAWIDITERVESEAEVRRAKAAAEAANHAKSDFLAKMSHELRTPLNSVIGFSEVLEDQSFGPLNDRQRRYVGNILTSGRHLLQLINDILDLSKVEAGRMELGLSEFDVGRALAEVRTIVGPLADEKRLKLDVDVEEGLPPLTADQQKFKQILYNLIYNAIKFTPQGGRIRVAARRGRDVGSGGAGEQLEVAVADTGIGIGPEDLTRIFGEFEQVASAQTGEQRGTGLGLALSRKLVELHGGRVWAESEAGKGSLFRFLLPLAHGRDILQKSDAEPAEIHAPPGTGPLVLVVEDDRLAGELLARHLTLGGYRVARAASGGRAVALARELRPDAITIDILLPDEDGLDVIARLKSAPETREIPVVVVSITDDRELGLSLGATDWLVKPVARDALIGAVRRAVGVNPAAGARTALVVDDEPVTLELLTEVLTAQGFRVLVAHDGRHGVALALAGRPDVIVLDLIMPGITGFDVVRELRQHAETRETPILVFTVKDLTADERERLRGSVVAVVPKEGPQDLLRELARLRAAQVRRA